jgi:hypothetical protein
MDPKSGGGLLESNGHNVFRQQREPTAAEVMVENSRLVNWETKRFLPKRRCTECWTRPAAKMGGSSRDNETADSTIDERNRKTATRKDAVAQ